MYVCICNAVTDGEIREAYAAGAHTFDALQDELGVATCCGCCEPTARDLLARCQAEERATGQADARPTSPLAVLQFAAAPMG